MIVGPSGVGKGTLIKQLMKKYPGKFEFSVSYTTRKSRPGEEHGKDYFFVEKDYYDRKVKKGDFFIEHM